MTGVQTCALPIFIGTLFAIAVAVLLNEIRLKKAQQVYQTIVLVPFLISIVIVSYLVNAFLATDTGFVNNSILRAIGKNPISWYTSPQYWPFILILVQVWKVFGYNSILYFSVLGGPVIALFDKQPFRCVQNLPDGLLRILVPSHRTFLPPNKPPVCFFKISRLSAAVKL